MKIGQIIGLSVLGIALNVTFATRVFADGGDATLIHGCVDKNGTTRIVTPATACKTNETATHWPTVARIVTDETRITNTENKNTTQDASISAIQTKNTQQDAAIAALQGQGTAGGATAIKDTQGNLVVQEFGSFYGIRKIGTEWYVMAVNPTGFQFNVGGVIQYAHTTTNCTGTRYLFAGDPTMGFISRFITALDTQNGLYATAPIQVLHIQSYEQGLITGNGTSDLSQTFDCLPVDTTTSVQASPTIITLSDLGLIPPFRID